MMEKELEEAIKTLSIFGATEIIFDKNILEKMDNIDNVMPHNPLAGNIFGVKLSTSDSVYFRTNIEQALLKENK